MSGYSYSDEIAASFERVEKWLRKGYTQAAASELDHTRKLVSAELNALLEEVRDAEAAMVRTTTRSEQARIRAASHNQHVSWVSRD